MVETAPHRLEVFGLNVSTRFGLRSAVRTVLLVILVAATDHSALASDQSATQVPTAPQPNQPRLPYHPEDSDWIRYPDMETMGRLYPSRAWKVTAQTAADCLIDGVGDLTDCNIVLESPPGLGFGNSTLRLMTHFQMKAHVGHGIPTAGYRVIVPIKWVPFL